MSLPLIPPRTATLDIDGVEVTIRSLTRAEAYKFKTFKDSTTKTREEDGEAFIIACAFDCTQEEAKAWQAATPYGGADQVVDEILILSNIASKAQIEALNAAARGEEAPKAADPQP